MLNIYWKEILRQLFLLAFMLPLSPILLLWVIFTGDQGHAIENLSYKFLDLTNVMHLIWRMFVDIVRLAAWVTIVIFVAISVLLLINLILHEFGKTLLWFEPYHFKAIVIFETKAAWAAITIIVASMAVIINQLKLEIDQVKYKQEQDDRRNKESEPRKAKAKFTPTVTTA